jgi:hypothetical protein
MRQLQFLDSSDPQPSQSRRLELDDDTLRELVELMAQAMLAVALRGLEDDDEW